MNQLKTDRVVTVVTVTYNAKNLLEKTINSVLNQTYDNIEYIIVDGGSIDGTVDIVRKYDGQISYWVSEADKGIYHAMNKAIDKASGEFINFMNAGDTFADRDSVSYIMENMDDHAELVYGDHIRLNPRRICKAQDMSRWYLDIPFCHQTLFTKTELLKNTKFDSRFKIAADHNFIIKMYEEGRKFQYFERNLVIYAAGGVSQEEPLVACVESLYILLHSNASEEEVKGSWWYKLLKNYVSEGDDTEVQKYRTAFKELASVKFLHHPIKKLQKYRQLLKIYHSMN